MALLLPAVQKIREVPSSKWKASDNSVMELNVTISQKIKDEYANYETDTTIGVSVRVRFEGQEEERLLPFANPGLGGTKYYFYSLDKGKLKIIFHNTGVCDLTAGGSQALPIEEVSMNFQKIETK
jgi:hypothetical protein